MSYLAAYLPKRAPLGPAVGLLAASAIVLAAGVVLLARQREFAWQRFFQVAGWTLLAYVVIAGMIEYAFVYDHTHGAVLVVMTLMLLDLHARPAAARRLHGRALPAHVLTLGELVGGRAESGSDGTRTRDCHPIEIRE